MPENVSRYAIKQQNRTVYQQNKLEHSYFNIFTVRTSNTTSMLCQKMSTVTPLNNKITP